MASVPPVPPPPPSLAGTGAAPPPAPNLTADPPPAPVMTNPEASVPTAPVLAPSKPPEPKRTDSGELPPLPPVKLDPLAFALSYLIPGLGQVYQGRIGKGLLFFFGLYTLFFYGMAMGKWSNVWLPDVTDQPPLEIAGNRFTGVASSLWYRPQFLGQFWIGVAAWPAIVQYAYYDPTKETGPFFGSFQRTPEEGTVNDPPEKITLNKLQREGNKRWDLGWVYTVIAGVLNLLVMYDALAGPMFREPPPGWGKKDDDAPTW